MSNECIPLYDDGDKMPMYATVAVAGKRFVANVGTFDANTNVLQAALPTAGGQAFGIAAYDAPAGVVFPVISIGNPLIVPATVGAGGGYVTANELLQVDATGAVVPLVTSVPTVPTLVLGTAGTGGTFAAGAEYWGITVLGPWGESAISNVVTATLSASATQPFTWGSLPTGTTNVRLYRSTTATFTTPSLMTQLGTVTAYTDTGTATTAGVPPATAPVVGVAVAQAITGGAAGTDIFIRLSVN